MATPDVVEVLSDSQSNANASVATGAGTQVGDLLVAAFGNNYFDGAGMAAPTGTAGTWTSEAYGDAGVNTAHLRLYTREVTSGGAQTVTISPVSSEEVYLFVYVLRNWSVVDDAQSNASASQTTNPVAPSATAAGADDLLLCFWQTGAPHGGPTFTGAPSGMTDLLQVADPAGPFSRLATARQTLSASGATGSRTTTISASTQYAACSIVIAGASSGVTASGNAAAATTAAVSARKVAAVTGRACAAAAGTATAVKRTPITGRGLTAAEPTGQARKSAPAGGHTAAAVAGRAETRKVAPGTGRSASALVAAAGARKVVVTAGRAAGVAASSAQTATLRSAAGRSSACTLPYSAVAKRTSVASQSPVLFAAAVTFDAGAPVLGRAFLAATGRAAAMKTAAATGRASLAGIGTASATRRAPAAGTAIVVFAARHSQALVRPASGVCGLAAAGQAVTVKRAESAVTCPAAFVSGSTARHVGVAAGAGGIVAIALGSGRHLARTAGRAVSAPSVQGSAARRAPVGSIGVLLAAPGVAVVAPADPARLRSSSVLLAHMDSGSSEVTRVTSSSHKIADLNGGAG